MKYAVNMCNVVYTWLLSEGLLSHFIFRFWEDCSVLGSSHRSVEEGGGGRGCSSKTEETSGSNTAPLSGPGFTSTSESCKCPGYIEG